MDAPLLGLRKKDDKASKLHHTLQIDIYQEDCKIFDLFLIFYCIASITYKIVWYSLYYNSLAFIDYQDYLPLLLELLAVIYWTHGLYLAIEGLAAYSYMRSKDIKSSAEKLIVFMVLQTLYFLLCEVSIIYSIHTDESSLNENLLIISILTMLNLASIFVTLYFYSQKMGLADEIQKFDTSNMENAAFHKPYTILDI
jgi:hypothetical protein